MPIAVDVLRHSRRRRSRYRIGRRGDGEWPSNEAYYSEERQQAAESGPDLHVFILA